MPRAIGMFGHALEPGLLRQPAGVHVPRCTRSSRCAGATDRRRRRRVRGRPDARRSRSPARLTALLGRGRRRAAGVGRRAAVRRPPRRARRRRAARRRVPARPLRHFALNDAPTLAPLCLALVGVAGIYRTRPHARLRARRARPRGWPSRPSTRRDRARAADRRRAFAAPVAHARVRAWRCWSGCCSRAASSSPTRTRCSTRTRSATGCSKQSETAGEDGGKLGLAQQHRAGATTLRRSPGGWAGCRRWPRSAARSGWRCATAGSRCCCVPAPIAALPLPRQPGRASSPAGCCRSTRSSACSRPGPWSTLAARAGAPRWRRAGGRRCRARARRASSSASTTTSCWPAPTRAAGARLDGRRTSRRARRSSSSRSPPTSGRWTPATRLEPGATGNGNRWNKWPHLALPREQRRHAGPAAPRAGQARGLRAHDPARSSWTATAGAASAGS